MKMKNSEFVELFNGLAAVQQLKGVKFGLLVSKNVRTIQKELDYLENASKPSDEFVALSVQMNQLMNDKNEKEVKALENELNEMTNEQKEETVIIYLYSNSWKFITSFQTDKDTLDSWN